MDGTSTWAADAPRHSVSGGDGGGWLATVRRPFRLLRRGWQSEWRWLAAVQRVTIVVTEIPFVLASARASEGLVFRGLFCLPYDVPEYLAAMREGAASSSWLIHDHLTGEAYHAVLT